VINVNDNDTLLHAFDAFGELIKEKGIVQSAQSLEQ